jgi:hypothetical protein
MQKKKKTEKKTAPPNKIKIKKNKKNIRATVPQLGLIDNVNLV